MAAGLLVTHDPVRTECVEVTDVLAPGRGIVIGLLLSAVVWAPVAFLATHL